MSNRYIATFLVTVISILFSILAMFYAGDLLSKFGDMPTKPALATTLLIVIIVISAIIIMLSIATLLASQSANPETFKKLKLFNDYSFSILMLLLFFLSIIYSTQLSNDTVSIENITDIKNLTESLCNSLLLLSLPKILLFIIISTLCNIFVYFICLIDYRIDVEIPKIVREKISIKQTSKPKVQQKETRNSLEKEIKILETKLKEKELKKKYDALLKKLEEE